MWAEIIQPVVVIWVTLLAGAYATEVLNDAVGLGLARHDGRFNPITPLYKAALRLSQQDLTTERPDAIAWRMAPVLYFALAAIGLAVIPWSHNFTPIDITTSLVLWGAVEALAVVIIFLYGWSANGHFPLLGAYRYVSLGLSYLLISMFVLIGVALPAESLSLGAVVQSQSDAWNLIRQPLGLPLFLIVGMGVTFWGPLNFASSSDLASGVNADSTARLLLVWELARRAMLVAFSFLGASAFLGGWHGPLLPGPVWLVLKSLLVLLSVLLLGHLLPRPSPDRFLTLAWVLFLPLSFIDLIWAGIEALW